MESERLQQSDKDDEGVEVRFNWKFSSKEKFTDLYKAMPEIITDAHETWRQDWCLATRAAEEDAHLQQKFFKPLKVTVT